MNPVIKRYNRLSYIYDYLEAPIEYFRFASWRKRIKEKVTGYRVLEVGVGTGKKFPYYSKDIKITAIDFSPRMLIRARKKADREKIGVELIEMDVQKLNLRRVLRLISLTTDSGFLLVLGFIWFSFQI